MIRIVFLEDDVLVGSLTTKALETKGFEVTFINNLNTLRNVIRDVRPHLLLLDLEVGQRNSLEEIPGIHLEFPSLPIIIASSHHDSKEMVSCYEAGAKYYVVKPYEADELERMIRMALPQETANATSYIPFGRFRLDIALHLLRYAEGNEWKLNPKEFQLLRLLLAHKNKPVSRTYLLQEIWKNEEAGNSLNNYINNLRNYLKKDPDIHLNTLKGKGYSLEDTL